MVTLVELLDPTPSPLWTLVRQAGVTDVVTVMDGAEQHSRWLSANGSQEAAPPPSRAVAPENPAWSVSRLADLQRSYTDHGLRLVGIEDTPPMDLVRLGKPGRDQQIEHIITQVKAMGELEIPVLCYNWSAITSWSRTRVSMPLRGGALTTGFDAEEMRNAPILPEAEGLTEDQLWAGLEYFLSAVLPVAEQSGVALAMHPDDPPVSSIRGIPRIMNSVDSFRRLVAMNSSRANGITLCQGNFALMTDDIPALIREFGEQDLIKFAHFRDVEGTPESFFETFHDDGPTDMFACMVAYYDVGFAGPMRPDHVQTFFGEQNTRPGYETLGRLFALGYMTGLREAAKGGDRG